MNRSPTQANGFYLNDVQTFDCEGLVASITEKKAESDSLGKCHTVLCGNDKLMSRFKVDLSFNGFRQNMEALEKEGKTVVCLVVNGEVRCLITLEELHTAKFEAQKVIHELIVNK